MTKTNPDPKFLEPHPITCIKKSIRDCLRRACGNSLTVVCDNHDCWRDDQLFEYRQAINITAQQEVLREPVRQPREGRRKLGDQLTQKDLACSYDAQLDLEIQIYVEQCDCDDDEDDCECLTAKDKAYSILAHIVNTIMCHQDEIRGRRIIYRSSSPTQNSEGETEIAVVVASFEVHYLFDTANPYAV